MDACDPTGVLFTKIRRLEPDNGSKIIGYILLQDLSSRDLMRLALGPETLLQSLILRVKFELGISSNGFSTPSTPPSPSPLNPISRPINIHPTLSQPSSRLSGNGFSEFARIPSSPSLNSRSRPFQTAGMLLPCSSVADVTSDSTAGDGDFLDENQLGDYLSFLNDPFSKNDKSTDQFGFSANSGDNTHLHRRSFSASDVCFDEDGGISVGSPSSIDYSYQQHEEMKRRMKAAHQQRLAAAQFITGVSSMPYDKSANFLLHQRNLHRPAPVLLGEERVWYGSPGRRERDYYMGMRFGDHPNSASRQIYLTFPADSSFKDEDVSNYFNIFGPVQDVRIPYQQKRMFGFVTFVRTETVRLILARGNPHFICDSRVLVKPYKEKGKLLDKKQQHQQMERGNFSPCSSPSGIGSRDSFDFRSAGPGILYNTQEQMESKMEPSDVHQAVEFERRRFMNLQLPELKNDSVIRHQRSLSIGSPLYFSSVNQHAVPESQNINEELVEDEDITRQHLEPEALKTCADDEKSYESSSKDETKTRDLSIGQEISLENILPDSLFASPTKSSDVHQSDALQANKSISVVETEPIHSA